MRFYLISDNVDTQMGMRLAGIEGVVVHEPNEVRDELSAAMEDKDIAVILITEKLVKMCEELVYDYKLNHRQPLIVEIPDRHATSNITENISRYIESAIGLKL
ncbi:MAG: V-type ATP synthase subunit F [Oscillospiraceae bacterium]|nr:V-type ATP synthase subunit F [Oscillospiraceae bacterium]